MKWARREASTSVQSWGKPPITSWVPAAPQQTPESHSAQKVCRTRCLGSEQNGDTAKLHNGSPRVFLLTLASQSHTRCQGAWDGTQGSVQYGVTVCMASSPPLPSYPSSRKVERSREISVLAGRRWQLCDSRWVVSKGHHLGQPGEKATKLQNLSKSKLLTTELSPWASSA